MKPRWGGLAALAAVVIMSFPAVANAERRIVVEGFEGHRNTMALQFSGTGLTLADDTLDLDGSARLGGATLAFKWDLARWIGLEFSVGSLSRSSEGGLVSEDRGLVTFAALWYFARHHHHRFYGITGLSGLSTTVNIGETQLNYNESSLTLGVGSEWMISRSWALNFEVRTLLLDSADEEEPDIVADANGEVPYPPHWYDIPEERVGALFNIGIAYRF
jgi:opacity protein-like surface antigen